MGLPVMDLAASRRQLVTEGLGIAASGLGFGFVYGLAAREAGFSPIEATAMSAIVFAGAAQFAAVGYVVAGVSWPAILLLTALLNARHVLYSAALRPWLKDESAPRRAAMAHVLTDEAFALAIAHFRRLGRTDAWGYWVAAVVIDLIPWTAGTIGGVVLGGQIPDPALFGLDVIFPASMIGLAVGLVTGRRELVAAVVGASVGVVVALVTSPAVGIIAGGLIGPAIGLLVPAAATHETSRVGTPTPAPRYAMPGRYLDDAIDQGFGGRSPDDPELGGDRP
jgi:4-azaleucine resistance transporter AzlC